MNPADLATPCALVDAAGVERNVRRMAERASALGVRLRPHVKTHKCVGLARLQAEAGARGLTVSTLAEAEFFAKAGFGDLTYAVPLSPARVRRAVDLCASVDRLAVLVDQEATFTRLETEARERGILVPVFLKVDCGYHRAGVDPRRPESRDLARRLADSLYLDFRGLLTHAGHAYGCRTRAEIRTIAAQERDVTTGFADALRGEGVAVEEVSVGSTPTMSVADDLAGVTEIRPGNYVFYDVLQAAIGSCALGDVSFSVLGTVLGRYEDRGTLILDTGATALSKDPGPAHVDPDCGFGLIAGWPDGPLRAGLRIVALSQEHAVVAPLEGALPADLDVGDRVRVLPNHACLAAAMFDRYYVLQGSEVVDIWEPTRGW